MRGHPAPRQGDYVPLHPLLYTDAFNVDSPMEDRQGDCVPLHPLLHRYFSLAR